MTSAAPQKPRADDADAAAKRALRSYEIHRRSSRRLRQIRQLFLGKRAAGAKPGRSPCLSSATARSVKAFAAQDRLQTVRDGAGPRRDDARDRPRRKGRAARSPPGNSLVRLVTKPITGNTIALPLARPERLELPTLGFEDRYSIQLSYGRADVTRHSTARPPLEASRRRS